jgi:Dynamitin
MTEEHAADEAAGEVIFSSDGLPPVARSMAPRTLDATKKKKAADDGDMTILDSGNTTAEAAFEIFSGKVYPLRNNLMMSPMGGMSSTTKVESLTQRLARLQQETAELEQDLALPVNNNNSGPEEEAGGPALMTIVTTLQQTLKRQEELLSLAKNQEALTRSMQQHSQEWETSKNKTQLTSSSQQQQAEAAAGVVTTINNTISSSDLQQRLLQVEKLVGDATTMANNKSSGGTSYGGSLLARLEEMETFLKALDPKGLEQASAKAKVIRSDLEAASKARSKLTSAATFRKEDAKTIAALYDQMSQLEGLSGHLPALVARLQQLANLHAQSSTFAVRLTQSEKEVVQLQTVMKQLEETVTKVESGMTNNVKVIEKNMQELDERIKKL